ncbi:hypothetical protein BDP27DRAFT_224577 [Rhodocollybia butyracea]|uniref:DUF6534 domain-containing protein n=1 Tax=Rhodocollybia butyracea TaxID=206335 RepID=A0A9P5UBK6_9AGAR|nr:hypothetical protein BDP27DRAFT_224577 [Rhodocollybia butyracea]
MPLTFATFRMASVMVCSAASPPLHNTMGALLIGVMISAVLWGISVVQTYIYFSTFFNQDTLRLKSFVSFVFILDTAHQAMLCHLIYVYLVSNFGDVDYLGVVVWSILVMVLLSAIIAVVIQLFMCWRIWILSDKNVFWIGPIILIVVASFAITMVYFGKSWSLRTWVELAELSKVSRGVNGLNFGGDIAITFAMVYLLGTSKSGIKRTDALVNHLMHFCLKTGLLTTLCAICSLISISVWPETFVYIAFYCALARLYANSFLATLNARAELRTRNRPRGSTLLSFSRIEWARQIEASYSSTIPRAHLSVKQETQSHIDQDIEMENVAETTLLRSLSPASASPV